MTAPIAWELLEDAVHDWVAASTGLPGNRVCMVEPLDSGAPDPGPPSALLQCTDSIRIGQADVRKIPSTVIQRVTVCVGGPGSFGVRVYVGFDFDAPAVITYVSTAVGDDAETPAQIATALLAELDANLPEGITAEADPKDAASLLVTGSSAVPLFASEPVDESTIAVTPVRERFPELECEWWRLIWRVTFRAEPLRGFGSATDMMTRAQKHMSRLFQPRALQAGWQFKGWLLSQPIYPPDRSESQATLDFALEGFATAAYQDPAVRRIGFSLDVAYAP